MIINANQTTNNFQKINTPPRLFFGANVQNYDILVRSRTPYKSVIDFISEHFLPLKENAICSIGCNVGVTETNLAKRGFRVIGLDQEAKLIPVCNQSLQGLNGSKAIQMDITTDEFKEFAEKNHFAIVYSALTLEHFNNENLSGVLKNISQMIKPQGFLITSAINPDIKPSWGQKVSDLISKPSYRRFAQYKFYQVCAKVFKGKDLAENYGYVEHSPNDFLKPLSDFQLVKRQKFQQGEVGSWGMPERQMEFYIFQKKAP